MKFAVRHMHKIVSRFFTLEKFTKGKKLFPLAKHRVPALLILSRDLNILFAFSREKKEKNNQKIFADFIIYFLDFLPEKYIFYFLKNV